MGRIRINSRILTCYCQEMEYSDEPAINLSANTVFEFLSEEYEASPSLTSIDEVENDDEGDNQDENRSSEDNDFWENHHQLLQSTICKTSSLESRIRKITKEALKEVQESGKLCSCGRPFDEGCRKCQMEGVCRRLQDAGYNCAINKSKWKTSANIPSGEHTFLDVVDNSNPKREVKVIIELNFRSEFEIARANEEYLKLIKKLPKIFVGKMPRLLALLKIVCAAAKKCMKEKKMHIAPWRKHRYMQAKWLRTCERSAPASQPSWLEYSARRTQPTMSMLTLDLMEKFSSMHRPAPVAVV